MSKSAAYPCCYPHPHQADYAWMLIEETAHLPDETVRAKPRFAPAQ